MSTELNIHSGFGNSQNMVTGPVIVHREKLLEEVLVPSSLLPIRALRRVLKALNSHSSSASELTLSASVVSSLDVAHFGLEGLLYLSD